MDEINSIFKKLNSYVTQLAPDEEEKYISGKDETLNQLNSAENAAERAQNAEGVPEQLMGALQLYGYFRNRIRQDPLKSLKEGLSALEKSINALSANL